MQEVVIVGGGIAGATVALELVERGVAVNLVDGERAGGAATGASAGMLAPQYESSGPTPLYRLLVEARTRWKEYGPWLEELSGVSLHMRWDGMLVANLTDEERTDAEADLKWQREAGQSADMLDGPQAREIQEGISAALDSFLWLPEEGQVDSQALSDALPAALRETPARVLSGIRVAEVLTSRGRASGVRLEDDRTLEADTVVIAAGAWSGEIEGPPRRLPVRPVRGHMVRFPPGSARLGPLLATHAGRYLVPRADGSILAGSTMDDVGFDRSLSDDGLAAVRASAAGLLPPLAEVEPSERWADLRPLTGDGAPIMGTDPELPGLVYATGYGRNGILLGPLAARAIADVIVDGETGSLLAPFTPARFLP